MRRLLAVAFVAALPSSALGQDQPSADLRGTFAPLHHEAGMGMESVRSPGTGDTTAGWRGSYAFRPVVLRGSDGEIAHSVLEHQFTGDFVVSVGIVEHVTLGIDLPFVMGQVGDDYSRDPNAVRFVGAALPPTTALGDVGLRLKITMLKPDTDELGLSRGFGLAADERFTLPSGDEKSFLGEGAVTSETRLLAELSHGPITGHLRAGAKVRADTGAYACDPALPVDDCVSRFGHELPLGFGLALHPKGLGIDPNGIGTLFVETRAYLPLDPVLFTESSAPAGWFASVAGRLKFGDVALLAGVEAGLLDGVGNAPVRATIGVSVAPREPDQDGDGIPDAEDKCPTFAEDRDSFEDSDGCPEMDNDGDGVPDALDQCPAVPGASGDAGNGCPAVDPGASTNPA